MPAAAATLATPTAPTFSIGELAREFDLTTRAIRFYEDCGLLEPQRNGRQRVYTARDRTRLKLTLRGKRLGLSLAEVKELVDMYESPRDTQPQLEKFMAVLAAHRGQLEQRLLDLHATLDEVRAQEKEARRLLSAGRSALAGAGGDKGALASGLDAAGAARSAGSSGATARRTALAFEPPPVRRKARLR